MILKNKKITKKKKRKKRCKESEAEREREREKAKERQRFPVSIPSQSPSLSGCLCENKSISLSYPPIILAEVRKVDNPCVAFFLTHVGSEPGGFCVFIYFIFVFLSSWELNTKIKRERRTAKAVTTEPTSRLSSTQRRISALMLSGRCWI